MENNSLHSDTPDWLRDIQIRSWEPEIILSSIITIGLLQLPDWIRQQIDLYDGGILIEASIDDYVSYVEIAIYWLTFGFISHLVLRGVWVGMVGLSFVFPEGIRRDKIHYAPRFERHVRSIVPIRQRVLTLEKVCSSVFAVAFLMFMCIIGTITFLFVMVNVPSLLFLEFNDYVDTIALGIGLSIFLLVAVVLGIIYLIDFLTLGLLKKVKWLSRVYYPIYRFFNVLTLSFLYRDIYYVLITNFTRWKILLGIFVYFAITLTIIYQKKNEGDQIDFYDNDAGFNVRTESYDDRGAAPQNSANAMIQSDIIEDDVLRLFVRHQPQFEDTIKAMCNYEVREDTMSDNRLELECLGKFYQVFLQDSLYAPVDWYFHQHPVSEQKGILTWIDVAELPRGPYVLAVRTLLKDDYAVIPFFKK